MTSEFVYAQPVKIFFGQGEFKKLGAVLEEFGVTTLDEIPAGHKIARRDIAAGENIVKYGFPIGTPSSPASRRRCGSAGRPRPRP